jgi:hypothetical protein
MGGVGPEYRHISHTVASVKAAHAIAELIDFPNDIIAHHERRPVGRSLRVEMAPEQYIGVLQTRSEHADPHLASAGRRQGSVDDFEPVGTAEAPDL